MELKRSRRPKGVFSMITSFRFVKGAVSKKTLLPVLSSAHVYSGRVQAGNGKVCIDHPCELTAEFTVRIEDFIRAVDSFSQEPSLVIEKSHMELKSGSLKIKLPLVPCADYPRQDPPKDPKPASFKFLDVLKELEPYIGSDASRDWCCGILFREGIAWATNNATLVKALVPDCPFSFILPSYLVDEILRIGMEPVKWHVDDSKLTLFYENGAWIQGVLLYGEWPPVEKVSLEAPDYITVTDEMRKGTASVAAFCPDSKFPIIVLSETGVATSDGDQGANFSCTGLRPGNFRADLLLPVLQTSDKIGFIENRIAFSNSVVQGALIGVRL